MISARRTPSPLVGIKAGPIELNGCRYGVLKYREGRGWTFDSERPNIRSVTTPKMNPERALPFPVYRALCDDYEKRNPIQLA